MAQTKRKTKAAPVTKGKVSSHASDPHIVFKEVELIIPGELKNEPIFYYIIKDFSIVPNIIEASFSTEMGWALVRLQGKEKELSRLFDFLREKGVRINFR
jgi:hypothetical protein